MRKSSLLFVLSVFFISLGFYLGKNSVQPSVLTLEEKVLSVSATPTTVEMLEDEGEKDEILNQVQDDKGRETAMVERVIDGDTIKLSDGRSLRYIGIDTAERPQSATKAECFAKESFEKNKELVEGKTIILEKDVSETDRHQRLLRYVYVGELFVNDYLVREGFAYASSYPPDVKYQEKFRISEQYARENNKGLWGGCK